MALFRCAIFALSEANSRYGFIQHLVWADFTDITTTFVGECQPSFYLFLTFKSYMTATLS